jgi:hypothetical protein
MDVPAEALWALIENFGDCSWMPEGTNIEVEGEGVGMTRIVNGVIREQLVALDAPARTLVYRIHDEGAPFPATGYEATIVVGDDAGATTLRWSCDATPKEGTTAEELKATIEGMYELMGGWIEDRVKAIG